MIFKCDSLFKKPIISNSAFLSSCPDLSPNEDSVRPITYSR